MHQPNNAHKDAQRIVSRAERLRAVTAQSSAILTWGKEDVHNMAEAASMLWDQAQSLFQKDATLKHMLNAAISQVLEPLLMLCGEFKLSANLAKTRIEQAFNPEETNRARAFRFLMLSLKFRFEDNFEWERQTTYSDALLEYQHLTQDATPQPADLAFMALGMSYLGLQGLSDTMASELSTLNLNPFPLGDAMPTPKFWRDSYASPLWRTWAGHSAEAP